MENSLTELWSIFDFLMPGYLLTHGKFSKKYELPIAKRFEFMSRPQMCMSCPFRPIIHI
jgi:hypothetical protein